MKRTPKTPDYIECLENDIRMSNPGLALAADYGTSRSAAIELMCRTCCGGDKEYGPENCKVQRCPLWQYRPGATRAAPCGIPSSAVLEARKRKVNSKSIAALHSHKTQPQPEQLQ